MSQAHAKALLKETCTVFPSSFRRWWSEGRRIACWDFLPMVSVGGIISSLKDKPDEGTSLRKVAVFLRDHP